MYSVVTVDGILLTKSGTMTGGISGGMEARSNKWDDSTIGGLYCVILILFVVCLPFYLFIWSVNWYLQLLKRKKINGNLKWKLLDQLETYR